MFEGKTPAEIYELHVADNKSLKITDVDWLLYLILRKECSKYGLVGFGSAECLQEKLKEHLIKVSYDTLDVIDNKRQWLEGMRRGNMKKRGNFWKNDFVCFQMKCLQ